MTSPLGILMLDTRFPRPRGDIGNPATFSYPVVLRSVRDASPVRVIHQNAQGLVDAFCDEARQLQTEGCKALVTSCGFLALHQRRLADAVTIPVATSSLLLLPWLRTMFGASRRIGVLTASAQSLSNAHFDAVGAAHDTPVVGMPPDGEFARVIIGNEAEGNFTRIADEVVAGARALVQQAPDIAAIVLECTNMGPYRDAIEQACGKPVFDLVDLANLLMQPSLATPAR